MRWKRIRPYVGFKPKGKTLTDYEKRKVRKYYKAIEVLDSPSRPVHVYRGKSGSKRLKGAQEYAQHPAGLSELRVAFIPHPSGEKPHLSFSKDGRLVSISDQSGVRRRVYLFSDYGTIKELFDNPETIIARIKKADKGRSSFFRVLNGEWEIGSSESALKFIPDEIRGYIAQYGSATNPDKNHWAEKWLIGLAGYSFFNQSDYSEYKAARGFKRGKKKMKKNKKHKGKADV